MKILAIEVMSSAAGMLLIEGNQQSYAVENLGKPLSIPKEDTSIKNLVDFQSEFANYIKHQTIDRLVLCEGGNDSKKI